MLNCAYDFGLFALCKVIRPMSMHMHVVHALSLRKVLRVYTYLLHAITRIGRMQTNMFLK